MGSLTRLGCELGLQSPILLVLVNFSDLFNLASSGLLAAASWIATVGIHPLEFREGHGDWMKTVSYNQEMGDKKIFCAPGAPWGPVWYQ